MRVSASSKAFSPSSASIREIRRSSSMARLSRSRFCRPSVRSARKRASPGNCSVFRSAAEIAPSQSRASKRACIRTIAASIAATRSRLAAWTVFSRSPSAASGPQSRSASVRMLSASSKAWRSASHRARSMAFRMAASRAILCRSAAIFSRQAAKPASPGNSFSPPRSSFSPSSIRPASNHPARLCSSSAMRALRCASTARARAAAMRGSSSEAVSGNAASVRSYTCAAVSQCSAASSVLPFSIASRKASRACCWRWLVRVRRSSSSSSGSPGHSASPRASLSSAG